MFLQITWSIYCLSAAKRWGANICFHATNRNLKLWISKTYNFQISGCSSQRVASSISEAVSANHLEHSLLTSSKEMRWEALSWYEIAESGNQKIRKLWIRRSTLGDPACECINYSENKQCEYIQNHSSENNLPLFELSKFAQLSKECFSRNVDCISEDDFDFFKKIKSQLAPKTLRRASLWDLPSPKHYPDITKWKVVEYQHAQTLENK